jgi:hypothetical protein
MPVLALSTHASGTMPTANVPRPVGAAATCTLQMKLAVHVVGV